MSLLANLPCAVFSSDTYPRPAYPERLARAAAGDLATARVDDPPHGGNADDGHRRRLPRDGEGDLSADEAERLEETGLARGAG